MKLRKSELKNIIKEVLNEEELMSTVDDAIAKAGFKEEKGKGSFNSVHYRRKNGTRLIVMFNDNEQVTHVNLEVAYGNNRDLKHFRQVHDALKYLEKN